VLSRGYRSAGGDAVRVVDPARADFRRDGDEPVLLARSLPGVPVIVCPDRARGASVAIGRGADVLLLDDGFQHRRLHRDVDIVLWDRAAEASRGRLVPAGNLREPVAALERADLVMLVDRGTGFPEAPRRVDARRLGRVRLVAGAVQEIQEGRRVHALSGIADPESFERSLADLGLVVAGATRHADHHPFTARDVRAAAERAASQDAEFLAVTAKDHGRWPRDPSADLPVPAIFDLDVTVEDEGPWLDALLARIEEAGS
jgi:tetraacyldisaccharide 4'-kinase